MQNLVLEVNNVEKSFMSKEVLTIEELKVYENEKNRDRWWKWGRKEYLA